MPKRLRVFKGEEIWRKKEWGDMRGRWDRRQPEEDKGGEIIGRLGEDGEQAERG